MKKNRIFIVLLLLIAVLSGCTRTKTEPSLDSVLSNVRQLGENLESLTAELVYSSASEGVLINQRYTLLYSKGRYRLEGIDSEGRVQGNLFDGEDAWGYVIGEKEVSVIRNSKTADMFAELRNFGKNDDLKYQGTVEIEGRTAHVIEGTKTFEGSPSATMTWWIDEKTWFPFILESTQAGVTSRATYQNFAVNPALDDKLFTFTPPEDAIIHELP
ncbi:MAG: outer membrane lipoprotein carrier protein LolA [Clostridiales bacterium]|jgi:outer membrane lipoprotein-sorting protein|nr:outer membrane lipoprotein carrier protein LolA [Clostridiales bacterium]